MSFYRSVVTAVAAFGLASSVLAADENINNNNNNPQAPDTSSQQLTQTADATPTAATNMQSADQAKLDINKATTRELMKVKGLSASKAKAIVAYRKHHGDFKSLDDLKNVKGFQKMNDDHMKEIEDQLTAG